VERTLHWSPWASSDTVSCSSPITHGSSSSSPFSLSPLASSLTRSVFHSELKTWLFSKYFPSKIPFSLPDWFHGLSNDYSAQRLDLFAWRVRLSRLLVGFRTHFKSTHFHFISFLQLTTCHKFISWSMTVGCMTDCQSDRLNSSTSCTGCWKMHSYSTAKILWI